MDWRKIGTTNVPDEQCVARHHTPRLRGFLEVGDDETNTFRCVAGSFEDPKADFAHLKFETVRQRHVREFRICALADIDLGTGASGEFPVAGDKIGVKVGLKDVSDLEILLACRFQVDLHIALWIDHRGLAVGTDHVRGMSQTGEIKLFEIHDSPAITSSGIRVSPDPLIWRAAPAEFA